MTGKPDVTGIILAGATTSYYIQAKDERLVEVLQIIKPEISNGPVICESGGMCRYITPGLFFLVKGDKIPVNKKHYLSSHHVIINFKNGYTDFDFSTISFRNNAFYINPFINKSE